MTIAGFQPRKDLEDSCMHETLGISTSKGTGCIKLAGFQPRKDPKESCMHETFFVGQNLSFTPLKSGLQITIPIAVTVFDT